MVQAFCFSFLQVQRIYEYHRLLMRLYTLTPKDHPDYHDLRHTIACVASVGPTYREGGREGGREATVT